jgi:hypothetical protein
MEQIQKVIASPWLKTLRGRAFDPVFDFMHNHAV